MREEKPTSISANDVPVNLQESDEKRDTELEIVIESQAESKEQKAKQSEEFWDYSKKTKEQIKCYEDGEALNSLFEDKHEDLRVLAEQQEKLKAEEKSKIVMSWPNIPSLSFKRSHTLPVTPSDAETAKEMIGE
jgi:hypothetical protein